jgi:putative acetyltransferase
MGSTLQTIEIRRAEVTDAEAMHTMFCRPKVVAGTLQVPYPSLEMWRKRLTELGEDDYLLVACVHDRLVGNVGLHRTSKSPRRRHVGYVVMAVQDDWQGKGVGSALLKAALDLADNWLNYTRLELTVFVDNESAVGLYKKFGFEIEGTCKAYAFRDGKYVDTYLMARLKVND